MTAVLILLVHLALPSTVQSSAALIREQQKPKQAIPVGSYPQNPLQASV
jgi:hypothetical protein